jgi:hypothetical protein
MTDPTPTHMIHYSTTVVPDMLTTVCGVETHLAHRIGDDILHRAEALAALATSDQQVLIAPFLEEAAHHQPLAASIEGRAQVMVVVRNSLLEQVHHDGLVTSGAIVPLTRSAAEPLSQLLAARRRDPIHRTGPNPFTGLADRYPRAWACLTALAAAFTDRRRHPLRLPAAPIPELPHDRDTAPTSPVTSAADEPVFSAIDPRNDPHLIDQLRQAATDFTMVLCTSALSRYSRNSDKLHRTLEYLLAHRATILTSNYLIRPTDVFVRREPLVRPDSTDPYTSITAPEDSPAPTARSPKPSPATTPR